ncbi:MAG TPA: hypothetical protein VFP87_15365 [Chitinophagaceae bacterium]|nr:hypothetical protein [Chitinophagaceae bacterium]
MNRNKESKKRGNNKQGRHKNPLPGQISPESKKENANAREQADKDITHDAALAAHNKNDDLDEGETARLGEDKTGLI